MSGKSVKTFAAPGLVAALAILLSACSAVTNSLDVVGQGAKVSFQAVVDAAPELVTADQIHAGWSLNAPDGAARLVWRGDWGAGPQYDVLLEFDAQPFLDAGTDVSKLPDSIAYEDSLFTVGIRLDGEGARENAASPAAAFGDIVNLRRDVIGYHMEMDHYNVDLGNGNLFEWAKDPGDNDKDIVFVLDPQAFLDAGADPDRIEGWAFSKVTVDVGGKMAEVEKLLKPFDLI